jgi:hypothetical protein
VDTLYYAASDMYEKTHDPIGVGIMGVKTLFSPFGGVMKSIPKVNMGVLNLKVLLDRSHVKGRMGSMKHWNSFSPLGHPWISEPE